ncbi:MAG: CPBP family glutamic-type intramembrane protease [Bacteroides sp.]|nr:CPBP family glutamic-type intramembrane protease [Bacteroides sp.]
MMKQSISYSTTLRPFWKHLFRYNWKFGLFLILLFGIPRFVLVLHANVSGGYNTAFIIFLLMWFTPLIFLTRQGRKEIGLRRPRSFLWLPASFLAGGLCCMMVFVLFGWLFSNPTHQPLNYIAGAGAVPAEISDSDRLTYFIIASIPSMLFSPIGEELLYRGLIHGSFTGQFGETRASVFDSLAFALTHLAHFGIIYQNGHWHFLWLPALLWVVCMFVTSQVFFRCKQTAGSLYGAIFSHAGFNLAMMYLIFYSPF